MKEGYSNEVLFQMTSLLMKAIVTFRTLKSSYSMLVEKIVEQMCRK
jgi:hypothetical protein